MPEYKLFASYSGFVGLVVITTLIVNLRGLILIPILTKTLGADAYGIWSILMVTISLLSSPDAPVTNVCDDTILSGRKR